MQNARALSLIVILVLSVECSFLTAPVLSQNTTSQTIQSQGEILYAPPPTPQPQLRVKALHLEDGLGNTVKLKGMQVAWNERMKLQGSTSQMASSPSESWFTLSDVQLMKNAGANCLEMVTINLNELMPTKNVPSEAFFTTWVDTWVNWCTQNQMYCILNIAGINGLYVDSWYCPNWLWQGIYSQPTTKAQYDQIIRDFFDTSVSKQDSNRQAFANLWAFIANRYKGNPYVMFGLMNEPFNFVDTVNDTTQTHLAVTYSVLIEQVIDAIRDVDSQQLVFIDIPFLWQPATTGWHVQPINRDNMVWEFHSYVGGGIYDLAYWESDVNYAYYWFVTGYGKPLFIGEYGFAPPTDAHEFYPSTWQSILASQVSYLNSQTGIIGRDFHCWDHLYGEQNVASGESDFTEADSTYIIQTVLG